MKNLLLLIIFTYLITTVNGQVFVNEQFDNSDFPPEGWTISEHSENWSYVYSREAKGENLGEAKFNNAPFFTNGNTKFISPVIDLTGISSLTLQFKQALFFAYGTAYIGVSTRSGDGPWHNVWEEQLSDDLLPQLQTVIIDSEDVGSSDFQFCIYYSGTSYFLRTWYIDDILLYAPLEKDIKVLSIEGERYLVPEEDYTPISIVKNNGTVVQSFDMVCNIYKGVQPQLIYSDTILINNLNPEEELEAEFSALNLTDSDEVYQIEIKSLLEGDMDTSNDLRSKYVYTYTQQRQKVLLEIGTGVTCGFCPGAAMGADDLVENGEPVAVIEYHYFDHVNDPFSNEAAHIRTDYYNLYSYPTSIFDGILRYRGGSTNESLYEIFLPLVEERKSVKTSVFIEFATSATDKGYQVIVGVVKTAPILDGNYILHMAITESNIEYEWENQDELNFVERIMLPDANGTPIDLINNDIITQEYNFEVEEDWVPANLEVVVFVQNLYNKEVIASESENLLTLGAGENIASDISNVTIYPNPARNQVNFSINVTKDDTFINISVYDITGKLMATPARTNLNRGKNLLRWNPGTNIPQGVYIVKTAVGNRTYTNKLIINK